MQSHHKSFRHNMQNPTYRKKVRDVTLASAAIIVAAVLFILVFSMMTG